MSNWIEAWIRYRGSDDDKIYIRREAILTVRAKATDGHHVVEYISQNPGEAKTAWVTGKTARSILGKETPEEREAERRPYEERGNPYGD